MDSKNVYMLYQALKKLGVIDNPGSTFKLVRRWETIETHPTRRLVWRLTFASRAHLRLVKLAAKEVGLDFRPIVRLFDERYLNAKTSADLKLHQVVPDRWRCASRFEGVGIGGMTIVQDLEKSKTKKVLADEAAKSGLNNLVRIYKLLAETDATEQAAVATIAQAA